MSGLQCNSLRKAHSPYNILGQPLLFSYHFHYELGSVYAKSTQIYIMSIIFSPLFYHKRENYIINIYKSYKIFTAI